MQHLPPAFTRAETWGIPWPENVDNGKHLDGCDDSQLLAIAQAVAVTFRERLEVGTSLDLKVLIDFQRVALDNTEIDASSFDGVGLILVQWVRHIKELEVIKHCFLAAVASIDVDYLQQCSWFGLVDIRQKIIVFCRLDDWSAATRGALMAVKDV